MATFTEKIYDVDDHESSEREGLLFDQDVEQQGSHRDVHQRHGHTTTTTVPSTSPPLSLKGEDDDNDDDDPELDEPEPALLPPPKKAEIARSTKFLDGLRGVAALCVFNQHMIGSGDFLHGFGESGANGETYYYYAGLPFVRVFYNGGGAAVSIFFVLSGCVLSQTTIKLFYQDRREDTKKSLLSAIVRRPLRLYLPCFLVALLISLAMHIPGNVYPDLPWSKAQESLWAEFVHCTVAFYKYFQPFQYHGSDIFWFPYDLVVWTIPIELKGSFLVYALLPVCCFGLVSQDWSVGLLTIATILLLHYGWWWGGCFLAGLALTIIDFYELDTLDHFGIPPRITRYWTPRVRAIFMNGLLLIGWYLMSEPAVDGKREYSYNTPGWRTLTEYIPKSYPDSKYYRFWASWGSIIFVYATLRLPWIQFIFLTRPFQYLGKVSFMLYLMHLPLMYSFGDRVFRVFGQVGFGSEPEWWDNLLYIPDVGPQGLSLRWDVRWFLMLMVSLGMAHLGTKFLDRPSVILGQKLSRSLGLGPPKKSKAPKEARVDEGGIALEMEPLHGHRGTHHHHHHHNNTHHTTRPNFPSSLLSKPLAYLQNTIRSFRR